MEKKHELKFVAEELKRSITFFRSQLVEGGRDPNDNDVFLAFSFFFSFVGRHLTTWNILTESEFLAVYKYTEKELLEYFESDSGSSAALEMYGAKALQAFSSGGENVADAAQIYFAQIKNKVSVSQITFLAAIIAPCTAFPYLMMDARGI